MAPHAGVVRTGERRARGWRLAACEAARHNRRLPLLLRILLTGSVLVLACTIYALGEDRLGSWSFFGAAAILGVCQLTMLLTTWRLPPDRRLILLALAFAVLCRVPLILTPVGYDSDLIRYIWDGRVQLFGYNPYTVMPNDPALAHTHDEDTVRMPSRNVKTPYLPAAQLFFRAVVWLSDTPHAMKVALSACDLLTILVLWRWLRVTGRNEWLVLTYAWSPLVILEVALSSHVDALGALWIVAAAYWLSTRRTALASVAFTLAVATKLLPIVLAPLFLGRARARDIVLGAALFGALYLPFMFDTLLPVGAVPSVVTHIRFNSPIFRPLSFVIPSQAAAALAVLVGTGAAIWARRRLAADDPAAWAWPMALALAFAPVIYPWYLLYFTPFLFTAPTLPLFVWTYSVLPVYVVWERALQGHVWRVPTPLMVVEFGVVVGAMILVYLRLRRTAPRQEDAASI